MFKFLSSMSLRLILCCALLFSAAAHAGGAGPATILVYGDSLSAAYGIAREQGWVALLAQRISQQALPYQVINASVSGETSSGGLARLSPLLEQHKPRMVLLELGANDGLRGLPIAEMRRNLAAMIELAQQHGAAVVLIGIMIPPNYGPRYGNEFRESFPQLAQHYRLPLVPFLLAGVADQRTLMQDDGLHPNADAQPLLLQNVWQVLAPVLKAPAATR